MAKEFNLAHESTGDIFRAAVAEESQLGQTVQSYLDEGRLVPDELTSRVVEEMVLEREDHFILDGFPRTVPQAKLLDEMLERRGDELDGVLYFELSEQEAVERLTGRLVCSECGKNYHREFMPPKNEGVCDVCGGDLSRRSDSTEEIVRKRLKEYDEKTRPLVPYYDERALLETIDASGSPDTVSQLTRKTIQDLN